MIRLSGQKVFARHRSNSALKALSMSGGGQHISSLSISLIPIKHVLFIRNEYLETSRIYCI